ncbi:hypothetical protein O7C57_04745 [Providencia sp. 21OH12SH02B-Prov]|uniref:hypothetical protein n=1 Tax=Providencia sp. 21OH12SH02B-Prov TaxID=3015951 RepID=UPI0022B6B12F|nr:hypothetical protein [Providencia sp. 21OH12SH02B-Prov]WBA57897.1 hypothetical protein O7C57_04745 [Providencia sp. 21OH12SH02B-Prov]
MSEQSQLLFLYISDEEGEMSIPSLEWEIPQPKFYFRVEPSQEVLNLFFFFGLYFSRKSIQFTNLIITDPDGNDVKKDSDELIVKDGFKNTAYLRDIGDGLGFVMMENNIVKLTKNGRYKVTVNLIEGTPESKVVDKSRIISSLDTYFFIERGVEK